MKQPLRCEGVAKRTSNTIFNLRTITECPLELTSAITIVSEIVDYRKAFGSAAQQPLQKSEHPDVILEKDP